jgi:hypothetical protein
MEKKIKSNGDKKLNLENQIKIIIEFLVLNYYPAPLSLNFFLVPDSKIFWPVIEFVLKKIDSSVSCTSLKDLSSITRLLDYPLTVSAKMFSDENSWEKLISLISIIIQSTYIYIEDTNPFLEYCVSAYELKAAGKDYGKLSEDFKSVSLAEENPEEDIETLEFSISCLQHEKKTLFESSLERTQAQVETVKTESYAEMQSIAELKQQTTELLEYHNALIEYITQRLGGRAIDDDLISSSKQELNTIQKNSLHVLIQIVEYQGIIESYRDQKENCEETLSDVKETEEIDEIQACINSVSKTNAKIIDDIKICTEKADALRSEILETETKYTKDLTQAHIIISEDIEFISNHAQKIAGWLESIW